MSIFIGILIFSLIVITHEMGHFIAARKCGILVEEFAVGMGPKIFGRQKGETLYTLRILPLGGFCRMLGEGEEEAVVDERSFNAKTVSQRFIVIFAGAAVNIAIAAIIFVGLNFFANTTIPIISQVVEGSPAYEAGLQPGDKIVDINGKKTRIFADVLFSITMSKGAPQTLTIARDGLEYEKVITPYLVGSDYKIGIVPTMKTGFLNETVEGYDQVGFFETFYLVFYEVCFYLKTTIYGLIQLITFNLPISQLSGPIGVVDVIGEQYQESIEYGTRAIVLNMLNLTGILSATIGVFNLLPLPALDGGRLVFLALEAVRRKPISPEKEGMVHFVGLVLFMALAIFVAYSDIMKIL